MWLLIASVGLFVAYIWQRVSTARAYFSPAFKDKHCLITGGSSGLGLAVAEVLLERGAKSVTLIARTESRLLEAKRALKSSFPEARVNIISCNVASATEVKRAFEKAERELGIKAHDVVFACAGASKPGFFLQQAPSDFESTVQLNYLGTVYTLQVHGRLVLVSSTLGLTGMVGYASYAPTKFAVRGLAECLRQELLPHGISVHIYYVATINSPGYEAENATKPKVTKAIEGAEGSDSRPIARAHTLLNGIQEGMFAITSDFITDCMYASSAGTAPRTPGHLLKGLLGSIVFPVWRRHSDRLVRSMHTKAD